jgi:hypothetical protein
LVNINAIIQTKNNPITPPITDSITASNWQNKFIFFCSNDFESYQVCAFLYRDKHDISNTNPTNKENPLIIHPPNFMFNIIPSIKSVKPEKHLWNYPFHLLSPLDSLLIFAISALYAPISTPLLGFKTITFTKDSLLSPYNCLRKLTGIKLKYHRFRQTAAHLVSSTLNHGKALTVYPVFRLALLLQKASLQFRYLKQLHLPLNSLLIRYKIFLFEFQPFNVDKFIETGTILTSLTVFESYFIDSRL